MKNTRIDYREAELPLKTKSYTPVPHVELIGVVGEHLAAKGLEIVRTSVTQNTAGSQIVVTNVLSAGLANPELTQTLVYTNSYNKSIPIRFVSGGEVFVCLNSMIVGDILSFRKHTSNVLNDLSSIINTAIDRMEHDYEKLMYHVNLMKEIELTRQSISELIGRMLYEEGILISNEVNEVIRQLRKPRFSDFSDNTMWSLYNHCTWALKEAAPARKMVALKSLHEFLTEYSYDLKITGR